METINGEHFVAEIGSDAQIYLSLIKGQENAANRNIKVIIKPDTKPIELETIFKMTPFFLDEFHNDRICSLVYRLSQKIT